MISQFNIITMTNQEFFYIKILFSVIRNRYIRSNVMKITRGFCLITAVISDCDSEARKYLHIENSYKLY